MLGLQHHVGDTPLVQGELGGLCQGVADRQLDLQSGREEGRVQGGAATFWNV